MSKSYRWTDKKDPRKDTQKAKQDQRQQGRKEKVLLRHLEAKYEKE